METTINEIECTRCGEKNPEDLMWAGDLCDCCHDDMNH